MLCGLLGKCLGHSLSPRLHALFGDYEYRLFERTEQELPALLCGGDLRGLNVTVPYKQTVLSFCDTLSDTVRAVGSANTLLFENGSILAENTDVYGFSRLLDHERIAVCGKKALILGSGGASKAVQYVLRSRGAEVTVISRSGENNYVNLSRHADATLTVNATPVGMYPDNGAAPLDLSVLPHCETVIDLIYNPMKTALLQQAEARGMRAVNGLYMLAAQAKRASELFQNKSLPDGLTEQAYRTLLAQAENILLIGMPSCGKTTVGGLLAEELGRPFFDSDAVFEERYGQTPADCLQQYGEPVFRTRESSVLKDLCKQIGCVIATGGGAVTVPENLPLLRQNGRLVYLERPLAELTVQGRPLSQLDGIDALAAQRLPLYRNWADVTVREPSPQEAVKKILEVLSL